MLAAQGQTGFKEPQGQDFETPSESQPASKPWQNPWFRGHCSGLSAKKAEAGRRLGCACCKCFRLLFLAEHHPPLGDVWLQAWGTSSSHRNQGVGESEGLFFLCFVVLYELRRLRLLVHVVRADVDSCNKLADSGWAESSAKVVMAGSEKVCGEWSLKHIHVTSVSLFSLPRLQVLLLL